MAIDFTKPVITGNYATDILPPIVQAQIALAQMLDPAVAGTLTGTPTGAYRFNGAAVEKFNGTAWAAHVLNIGGSAAKLAAGAAGQIPYQSAASTTLFSAAGTAGQVLTSGGAGAPTWTSQSALSVGTAVNATNATNAAVAASATLAVDLTGGAAGQIPYQSGADATAFSAAGTAGQVLVSGGAGAPTWTSTPSGTTPALGNDSTLLATTAYVRGMARAVGSVVSQAAAVTLTAANSGDLVVCSGATAFTVTLPAASTMPAGAAIAIRSAATAAITINRAGTDTITDGEVATLTSIVLTQPGALTELISNGSNGWHYVGPRRRYESPWTASLPGASVAVSVTHGLGATPRDAMLVFECTTATGTWAVGERIVRPTAYTGAVGNPGLVPPTITLTPTAVIVSTPEFGWYVVPRAGGAAVQLASASWRYRIVAEA